MPPPPVSSGGGEHGGAGAGAGSGVGGVVGVVIRSMVRPAYKLMKPGAIAPPPDSPAGLVKHHTSKVGAR